MKRRSSVRSSIHREADFVGAEIEKAALVIANPLRRQPLAVPRDVRAGDTPEGDPAILWNVPRFIDVDRYGSLQDWGPGGTTEQAFWAFLDLARELEVDAFVAFVKRFGTLGLWPYRTEKGHKIFGLDYWVPSVPYGIWTPQRYTTIQGDEYETLKTTGLLSMLYEPISEWQQWATWTQAVVEISFALRQGELANRAQWSALGLDLYFQTEQWNPSRRDFATNRSWQQQTLASIVQKRFLKWSGLVPVFRWPEEHPAVELAFGGDDAVLIRRTTMQWDWPENCLFPALVAQLLAVITSGTPTASCSRCGRLHPRRRKARVDQPVYCQACRLEARRETKSKSIARARARQRAGNMCGGVRQE